MSLTIRTATLSLALLLASTSLASAGFIWLAPDGAETQNGETVYSRQADEAPATDAAPAAPTQGRAWSVDPSVPVAGTVPAEAVPAPVVAAPAQTSEAAPVTAPITLQSQTVAAQPISSPGDQAAAPADLAATAPVVVAPVAAPASSEVTLATSKDLAATTAPMTPAAPASSTMPTAEAMVSAMPSATAAHTESPAPAAETPTPAVATVTAPVTIAATEPPAAAPQQPAAGVTVSPITGETVPLASYVPPATATTKVVEGFGKSVPLVIAMRQILPSEYSFAHGDGVDLSQSVSWEGGKPWPEVLDDAIRPIGLTAQLTGDTVMLTKKPAEMAPELTPPAADVVAPVVTSAPVRGAAAVLTNATIMQTPPAN